MMEMNRIYNENCLDTMAKMPDNYVDLVVTSPPYDNMRAYHGYEFDFEKVQNELYRVIKKGGTLVWVVSDQTIDGNESGTSFKQALYFKEIGFNLFDTMIWHKSLNVMCSTRAYFQTFEYMFVFSKGIPATVNLIKDVRSAEPGKLKRGVGRDKDGIHIQKDTFYKCNRYRKRENVWKINQEFGGVGGHPQQFPEKLAKDHIITWSNQGDLVYDPFSGSGTVQQMCILTGRNYIGSEISQDYCKIIDDRLKSHIENKENNLDKFIG